MKQNYRFHITKLACVEQVFSECKEQKSHHFKYIEFKFEKTNKREYRTEQNRTEDYLRQLNSTVFVLVVVLLCCCVLWIKRGKKKNRKQKKKRLKDKEKQHCSLDNLHRKDEQPTITEPFYPLLLFFDSYPFPIATNCERFCKKKEEEEEAEEKRLYFESLIVESVIEMECCAWTGD